MIRSLGLHQAGRRVHRRQDFRDAAHEDPAGADLGGFLLDLRARRQLHSLASYLASARAVQRNHCNTSLLGSFWCGRGIRAGAAAAGGQQSAAPSLGLDGTRARTSERSVFETRRAVRDVAALRG